MAGGWSPKRWLVLALAAGVVLLLALSWFRAGESSSSASAPGEETRPPAAEPPAVAAPPPVVASTSGSTPETEDPLAVYRAQTRYPSSSGRLRATALDLLEPNRRYETPRPIEATLARGGTEVVTYILAADQYHYSGDDVVEARLRVRRGDEAVPVVVTRGVAMAEGASGATGEEERLVFRIRAGEPTTSLDLARTFPDHHGPIQLTVEFEWEPGEMEEATLRIFSTPVAGIPAEFTGRDGDRVEQGSLVVDVGVDVLQPGFYRIDGNLFAQSGEPLAYASFKGELAAGETSVPLEFFGLLLRDLGVDGPYQVRDLRGYLFLDAEYPDRLRMRDATHHHWTRSYALESFSGQEFMSDHKARMLDLIEADLAAGIPVEHPGDFDVGAVPGGDP